MLKEEKELRRYCNNICSRGNIPGVLQQSVFMRKITALVKAVREDCAKVAEGFHLECENDQPEATWADDLWIKEGGENSRRDPGEEVTTALSGNSPGRRARRWPPRSF